MRVWSRPAFEPGNTAAVKHGAYSPKVREERAAELVEWLMRQRGLRHLHDESFKPAVWRWAQRQAMADLLLEVVTQHHTSAPCPGCDQCRGWEARWRTFDRTAERAGVALGLDPQSRADLLARMTTAGLIDAADEAASMLTAMAVALQQDRGAEALAAYAEQLKAAMKAAGIAIPAAPGELAEIEANLRDATQHEDRDE